jgi:YcxB-like protein
MSHEVILHYDEHLLRQAVLRFWWRIIGVRFIIALIVMGACLAWLVSHGDRSWFVGVVATVLALAVAFIVAIYFVHYRSAMRRFKNMGEPEGTLTVSETSLTLSSGAGSSTFVWSAVTELWQFPAFWLMFFSKSQFITLPLADFTPEAKAFVLERLKASGAKIG